MMTEQQTYTIQQVSQKTGLTVYTLRYYEDIGLLDPVPRATNGHRSFTQADINRIEFLKKLRLTGMSIEAMKHFVDLYREGHQSARARRELLEAHRQQVVAQIEELNEVLGFIDYKISLYAQEELRNERDDHHHEVSAVGEHGTARV
jgi:DNA-binding transcriptional MerR regulator